MITLYQFSSLWGVPNSSPFCMKVETYLRMCDIDFTIRSVNDPRKSPKNKLPYIKDGDVIIADSSFIIDYLQKKFPEHPDASLTDLEKAQSLCVQRMLEEHLYWAALYSRWATDKGWEITKKAFFSGMRGIAKYIAPIITRRMLVNEIYQAGMGRHGEEEIYQLALADLDALSTLLGDKMYFHDDKMTSIDASIHAFLANLLYVPFDDPMTEYAKNQPNLVEYTKRIHQKVYGKIS